MRIFKKSIKCVGHKIDLEGVRPLQDKLEAITKINTPRNENELKYFLRAIQYHPIYIANLSASSAFLSKLLKNHNYWKWTEESNECITNIPCLANQIANNDNIIIQTAE